MKRRFLYILLATAMIFASCVSSAKRHQDNLEKTDVYVPWWAK